MRVLDRATYRKIEWHLFNYHALLKRISEKRDDALYGAPERAEGRASGRLSDPTALRGISLLDGQDWVRVIDSTVSKYTGTEKQRMMILFYFEGKHINAVCCELAIEQATFYRWRTEIVLCAALYAARERLIQVA